MRKTETSTHGAKNKKGVPHAKKLEVYGIRWRLYSVHLNVDFGFDKTLTTWLVGSGNCSLVCFLEALIGFCSMRQYEDAWQRNNEVLPIKGDWTLFLFECKLSWFCFPCHSTPDSMCFIIFWFLFVCCFLLSVVYAVFVCFNFLTVFYTSYSWNISGLNKMILLNGAHKPFWLKMKKQLFPLAPIWSSWAFKTTQNQRWCYSGKSWSLASCCICWPRTCRKGCRKVFFHVSNQVKWRTRKILSWFPTAMDIFEFVHFFFQFWCSRRRPNLTGWETYFNSCWKQIWHWIQGVMLYCVLSIKRFCAIICNDYSQGKLNNDPFPILNLLWHFDLPSSAFGKIILYFFGSICRASAQWVSWIQCAG